MKGLTLAALIVGLEVVALVLPCSAALAAPLPATVVGKWPLTVKCGGYKYLNLITIVVANKSKVTGKTAANGGSGRIVGGSFDGHHLTFKNEYRDSGKTFTEVWTADLSQSRNQLRGTMLGDNPKVGGRCTFSGPRSPGS